MSQPILSHHDESCHISPMRNLKKGDVLTLVCKKDQPFIYLEYAAFDVTLDKVPPSIPRIEPMDQLYHPRHPFGHLFNEKGEVL